jgi:hypothetical protein
VILREFRRFSEADDLGVRGRIVVKQVAVVALGDDSVSEHDHRTDRYFALFLRELCLLDGEPHVLGVVQS